MVVTFYRILPPSPIAFQFPMFYLEMAAWFQQSAFRIFPAHSSSQKQTCTVC